MPALALLLLLLPLGAPSEGDIEVAHEHYLLANGLHVILAPDPALPEVEVNLWYQVGSKDEEPGRSGFAHLFEHLMFMGTERVEDGGFDQLLEAGGATNNATTGNDRTNYFERGPAGMLETMLWLEADRMQGLGDAITQDKLDRQREVVRNERRQTSENTPYGRARLLVSELMYPSGHPYHISVIGTHEDLQAATLDDVKRFFDRFYVPNNCSLVVVGDFDPEQARVLVERHFGSLAPGSEAARPEPPAVRLDGPRSLVLEDRVQLPRLEFVWHSPRFFGPGDAEMDLVGEMLAGGKAGRLTRRLVLQDRTAANVVAYQASLQLGSLFHVQVYVLPGADLQAVAAAVDEELARFRDEGPTEKELQRAAAVLEMGSVGALESLHARADSLNRYLMYLRDPDGFQWNLNRYRQATREDVQRWARSVLTDSERLTMTVLPEGGRAAADRPRPEVGGEPAAFTPPVPRVSNRPSGLELWHLERRGLPLVNVHLVLPGGRQHEPAGQAGLASLAASMLDEGAGDLDAVGFADALEVLGASFAARAGDRTTTLSLRVLKRNLWESLPLFHDALVRPRFAEEDLTRVRRIQVEGLRRALDDPAILARQAGYALWFGAQHPYGRPAGGHPASVRELDAEQALAYHRRQARPQGALLVVSGDVSPEEAERVAEVLDRNWPESSPQGAAQPTPAPAAAPVRVVLLNRPGAPQTVLRFLMPGHAASHPDRLPSSVLNTILGGSFTSRLNQNIREQHGFSYGARSSFARLHDQGLLVAQSSVRTDVTGAAITEFLSEFERMRSGDVSVEEAAAARAVVRSGLVSGFESLGSTVGTWLALRERGARPEAAAEDLRNLVAIDQATLNALAGRVLPLSSMLLVMVGDAQAVLPQLEGLPLPEVRVLDVPASLSELAP